MKRVSICLAAALLALATATAGADDDARRREFQDPSPTHRLGVNVHGVAATPEAREAVLDGLLEAGYGRISTNVNWTSDYMFNDAELAKFCDFARRAREKGLEVWLYDENTYPSGMAGDILLAENPDWEAEGLFFRQTPLDGGASVALAPDSVKRRQVFAVPTDAAGRADLSRRVELFDRWSPENGLQWTAPEGAERWLVCEIGVDFLRAGFQSGTVRGPKAWPYTSLLLPEVGRRFVEVTHKKYAAALGEPLGAVISATFTDEPSAMAQQYGKTEYGVYPWKANVSEEYAKRTGRALDDDLPAIALDDGPDGRARRWEYFNIVADFMSVNFFRAIREYDASQGIKSSGHLLLEESLMTHAPLYGDIMRCFREMDVPGVDELTGSPAETRRYLYSSRLASSAAELNGGSDVMCESCPISDVAAYGGAEAPTEQLRGVFNRLLLGGVTKTSDYMRLAREDAAGKRAFNEYVGRVISQLSGGRRAADVAVFYPIETVWARFRPYPTWLASWNGASGGDPAAQRTDAVFMAASDALFDAQIEFSYLDDRALRDATIDGGALALGDLRRSVLIFPATEVLSDAAFAKIEAFVATGGA
ncbi:MAG: hypothetical protein HUK22_00780, partial [Thermoguttaceae bacterium]|nr:hypothetical protein [Thermoguttaceae bacterium]